MATKGRKKQLDIKHFSLGAEELGLLLGLLGKAEDGQIILASAHNDINEIDIEALLSSASHSLLARDYCSIPPNAAQPTIDKGLKEAVTCLYNYKQVMYLNILAGNDPLQIMIHINTPKSFCVHLNKSNKVHLLEFGPAQSLGGYLIDIFDPVVFPSETNSELFEGEIPFSMLSRMTAQEGQQIDVTDLANNKGWSSEQVRFLEDDLRNQVVRGILIRVQTDDVESMDKYTQASKSSFLFLRGEDRAWTFQFSSQEDSAKGIARIIDRKGFGEALIAFLS